jgi:hypothetical protein
LKTIKEKKAYDKQNQNYESFWQMRSKWIKIKRIKRKKESVREWQRVTERERERPTERNAQRH